MEPMRRAVEAQIADGKTVANQLNHSLQPRWLVYFGDYHRYFTAFPCLPTGPNTEVIKSDNAADLLYQIQAAEALAYASPPTAIDLLPRCPDDVRVSSGAFLRLVGDGAW